MFLDTIKRCFGGAKGTKQPATIRRTFRPSLEGLEHRDMPSATALGDYHRHPSDAGVVSDSFNLRGTSNAVNEPITRDTSDGHVKWIKEAVITQRKH